MVDFDAQGNLYNVVESILRGDKSSQELLNAADDALERLRANGAVGEMKEE